MFCWPLAQHAEVSAPGSAAGAQQLWSNGRTVAALYCALKPPTDKLTHPAWAASANMCTAVKVLPSVTQSMGQMLKAFRVQVSTDDCRNSCCVCVWRSSTAKRGSCCGETEVLGVWFRLHWTSCATAEDSPEASHSSKPWLQRSWHLHLWLLPAPALLWTCCALLMRWPPSAAEGLPPSFVLFLYTLLSLYTLVAGHRPMPPSCCYASSYAAIVVICSAKLHDMQWRELQCLQGCSIGRECATVHSASGQRATTKFRGVACCHCRRRWPQCFSGPCSGGPFPHT